MSMYYHLKTLVTVLLLLGTLAAEGHAEQWNGSATPNGTIWRPGNVAIGLEPSGSGGSAPLLEIRRPLSGNEEVLLSLRSTFKDATATILQVDTKRVYVGGASSKASLVPEGVYDLAVGRGIAIGVNSLTERLPTDYRLVVGGKILAEEVRIKLIKDWADYVFQPDYRLASLPDVETYIQHHRHLPDMPSAAEVEQAGVDLGEIQTKLLRKIEELTLHVIEQHKTIATLQREVEQLQRHPSRNTSDGTH